MTITEQLKNVRESALSQIAGFLPSEQKYVNLFVPHCAIIKYIHPDGTIGLGSVFQGQLSPNSIDELPTDSLVSLLEQIRK
jgi:hypothetical protein